MKLVRASSVFGAAFVLIVAGLFSFSGALPRPAGLLLADLGVALGLILYFFFRGGVVAFPRHPIFILITAFVLYLLFLGLIFSAFGAARGAGLDEWAPNLRYIVFLLFSVLVYNLVRDGLVGVGVILIASLAPQSLHFIVAFQQFLTVELGIGAVSQWVYIPVRQWGDGSTSELTWSVAGVTSSQFSLASLSLGALALGLGVMAYAERRHGWTLKWGAWSLGIVSFLAILFTMRRGQILVAAMLLVGYLGFIFFKRAPLGGKLTLFLVFGVAGALGGVVLAGMEEGRLAAFYALAAGDFSHPSLTSFNARMGQIGGMLGNIVEHPWGVGLYPRHVLGVQTDIGVLQHFLWGGVIGGVLYIAVHGMAIIAPVQRLFSGSERDSAVLIFGLSLAFYGVARFVQMWFGGGGLMVPTAYYFWLLLGAWIGSIKRSGWRSNAEL